MTKPGTTRARAAHNRALAAIHIAKGQLGLDDDTYRALLRRVSAAAGAEVDSAARLDRRQMVAVLNELRRLGARRPGAHKPANYPGKPHNFNANAMPEMITVIEALLADMGLPWAYADAIARQQWGIERCAWVRDQAQLRAIIAALDSEKEKRERNAFIDDALPRLGMGAKELAELTAGMPKNWRRNRRCLKLVAGVLEGRMIMLALREAAPAGGAD